MAGDLAAGGFSDKVAGMRLSTDNLSCRRGGRTVFRGVGFELDAGELLLVTGANGSGKSSLLRVLAGLAPAAGAVLCDGVAITDWRAWQRAVTYVGHLDAVKGEMRVGEMVGYWGTLNGCSVLRSDPPPRIRSGAGSNLSREGGGTGTAPISNSALQNVLPVFEMDALCDRPIKELSAGQRRRLALTRLVMRKSDVWLLDEPLNALDARGRDLFWDCVARHRASGGLVVMVAHGLVMDGGRVLGMGT